MIVPKVGNLRQMPGCLYPERFRVVTQLPCAGKREARLFGCSSQVWRVGLRQPSSRFFHSFPPGGRGESPLTLPHQGGGKRPFARKPSYTLKSRRGHSGCSVNSWRHFCAESLTEGDRTRHSL